MIKIGIIGYGYWGPNLVRNFSECGAAEVRAVSDLRPERLKPVAARYPAIQTTANYRDLLDNPGIDAIAIATPVSTHFDLALQALKAGKHVLVEKPFTATAEQARILIEEAEREGARFMLRVSSAVNIGQAGKNQDAEETRRQWIRQIDE